MAERATATKNQQQNNKENSTDASSGQNQQAELDENLKLSQDYVVSRHYASASIDKTVNIETTELIEGHEVPVLNITFDKSDFVQVLRCAASYRLKTLTGEDLRTLVGRPVLRSEMEWAWAQAIEDKRICKVVGTNVTLEKFQDFSAPTGSYYYVINPCINKEHSINRAPGCSFRLKISRVFDYTNSFKDEIREKTAELSQAEGALNAEIQNAISLARKIEIHLRACENMLAHDKQMVNFKKGMIQLAALLIGGTIGNILGGPNMAVMIGQLVMGFGSQIIFSKLGLPNGLEGDQFNECINPEAVATTEKQRKEAAEAEKNDPKKQGLGGLMGASNMAQYEGKYEEEFQVQTLSKRLMKALSPDGPIAKESNRVKALMKELAEMDINILTLDQATTKAGKLGQTLDVNDESSYSQFMQQAGLGG